MVAFGEICRATLERSDRRQCQQDVFGSGGEKCLHLSGRRRLQGSYSGRRQHPPHRANRALFACARHHAGPPTMPRVTSLLCRTASGSTTTAGVRPSGPTASGAIRASSAPPGISGHRPGARPATDRGGWTRPGRCPRPEEAEPGPSELALRDLEYLPRELAHPPRRLSRRHPPARAAARTAARPV